MYETFAGFIIIIIIFFLELQTTQASLKTSKLGNFFFNMIYLNIYCIYWFLISFHPQRTSATPNQVPQTHNGACK
jgi:hypothetical protein